MKIIIEILDADIRANGATHADVVDFIKYEVQSMEANTEPDDYRLNLTRNATVKKDRNQKRKE